MGQDGGDVVGMCRVMKRLAGTDTYNFFREMTTEIS